MARITIIKADITQLNVDAIVNSAHPSLMAGSGLCGVIHKMAGKELERECASLGGCEKGQAKIIGGYNLKAGQIIHTVGPHYFFDNEKAPELLESCYLSILRVANENELKSIAIPSISTNIYKYPINEAASIALKTVSNFLENENQHLEDIVFVLNSDDHRLIYDELFKIYFK
ncbi:MAG: macro domain-containing protein [Patescibacteria group bacterium]|nr:macro domain-containing protein [Patescibacteria group bacterium]